MGRYITNEERGLPKYKSMTRSESLKRYWATNPDRHFELTEEQINKVVEKKKGYVWYNDGEKNYWIKLGQEIPDHFVKGMILSEEMRERISQRTREFNHRRWHEGNRQ